MKKITTTVNTVISTDIEVEIEFPIYLKCKEGSFHKITINDGSEYCPFKQEKFRVYESGSVHLTDYSMTEAGLSGLLSTSDQITCEEYVSVVSQGIKMMECLIEKSLTA